ncbi:MAG: hypothetical protein AB7F35_20555 [Acetobacteraceae bacterium]
MQASEALETARSMIRLHGLRAQAIAEERVAEMRQQGDTAGLERWQQVHGAIRELRRTLHERSRGQEGSGQRLH